MVRALSFFFADENRTETIGVQSEGFIAVSRTYTPVVRKEPRRYFKLVAETCKSACHAGFDRMITLQNIFGIEPRIFSESCENLFVHPFVFFMSEEESV